VRNAQQRVADVSCDVDEETSLGADAVLDVECVLAVLGAVQYEIQVLTAARFQEQLRDSFIVILN